MENMDALVMCAGYGERLKPISDFMPKALLPIGGKPLLYYTIQDTAPSVNDIIVLSNSRFRNQFEYFLENEKDKYNNRITIISNSTYQHKDRLGICGDLAFALNDRKFQSDLLILSGDKFHNHSIGPFVEHFNSVASKEIILAIPQVESPSHLYAGQAIIPANIVTNNKFIGIVNDAANSKEVKDSAEILINRVNIEFGMKYVRTGNVIDIGEKETYSTLFEKFLYEELHEKSILRREPQKDRRKI